MIDLSKLDKCRPHGSGFIARCPACAEIGNDKDGNHLKIDGEGRFCCVVHPGREGAAHRRRIWQLAGQPERRPPQKPIWRLTK